MTTVLVDVPAQPNALQRLQSIPGIHVQVIEPSDEPRPLPPSLLKDIQILFCSSPPQNYQDMKSLELIQITSAGYSQLFDIGLVENRIRACNALGVFDIPIAEWNAAMMVNLARDLRRMIHNQETATWCRSAAFQREIRGSIVGIWGYGGIGRQTARLAKSMGMTVHVLSRTGVTARVDVYCVPGTGDPAGVLPDRVFLAGQEPAFLRDLDFLILSSPLTKTTGGMIGEQELRALPPSAFLLNPARGSLLKEDALLAALNQGWISGAALDAHHEEPISPYHPLWRFSNVIITPHISGSDGSPHFLERVWDIFVQNVERYISRRPLLNELSQLQLQGI